MKFNVRKMLLLILSILLTGICCGCGDKSLGDQMYGELKEESMDDSRAFLASVLGVPASYHYEFETGDSGLLSISIDADTIQLPDTESMITAKFTRKISDADYKRSVAEAIFDIDAGIYVFDETNLPIEDITALEEYYEMCRDVAISLNDISAIETYDMFLDDLREKEVSAPKERTGAGDYSSDTYVGTIGDYQYLLTFLTTDEGYSNGFLLSYYMEDLLINYRPAEGMTKVSLFIEYGDGLEQEYSISIENKAEITQEEAVAIAKDFLYVCGIEDTKEIEISNMEWDYYELFWASDADVDYVTEYDGYNITFARSLDGTVPYLAYFYWLDNIELNEFYESEVSSELFTISVDDNGVQWAKCYDMYTKQELVEKIELLSWDEVIEAVNASVAEYYTENPTSYSGVNFNYIELTYFMLPDTSEAGTYIYTPVWVFSQIEENMLEFDYTIYPTQIFMINAITGEVINLPEMIGN